MELQGISTGLAVELHRPLQGPQTLSADPHSPTAKESLQGQNLLRFPGEGKGIFWKWQKAVGIVRDRKTRTKFGTQSVSILLCHLGKNQITLLKSRSPQILEF